MQACISQSVGKRSQKLRHYFQWPQFLSSQWCQAKLSHYCACSSLGLKIQPFSGLNLVEGMATHSSILAWRAPMDRGAWRATVYRVAKSRTRLSDQAKCKLSSALSVYLLSPIKSTGSPFPGSSVPSLGSQVLGISICSSDSLEF